MQIIAGKGLAANVAAWGTGGINVDGCRVGTADDLSGGTYGGVFSGSRDENGNLLPAIGSGSKGRWPANLIHDGSPEVLAEFAKAGELRARGNINPTKRLQSNGVWGENGSPFGVGPDGDTFGGDTGSAARFFMDVSSIPPNAPEATCLLCLHPITKEVTSCASVNAAEPSSSQTAKDNDSVATVVQHDGRLANAGRLDVSNTPAPDAASHSQSSLETSGGTVQEHAPTQLAELLAQRVKSAASLCDSCATATAQSLAAMLHGQIPESRPGQGSMPSFTANILNQNLVSFAEPLVRTGIIPTTASLSILFGSVAHAIYVNTEPASVSPSSEYAPASLRYQSKASRAERNAGLDGMPERIGKKYNGGIPSAVNSDPRGMSGGGERAMQNHHPTVKPISLCRYLCRLITPPGGVVLDPFAGSGSIGCGATLEGFSYIGIEMDESYVAIAEARLKHWAAQPRQLSMEVE